MRLIPVLDLQNEVVVHGIGGRRKEYRPLVSGLSTDSTPLSMAHSLAITFKPREIYIADLDAIAGRAPSWPILAHALDIDWWIDAGIQSATDLNELAKHDVAGMVIGLETVNGPDVLDAAVATVGPERILFSLDLSEGRMLGAWQKWPARDAGDWQAVVNRAIQAGVRRLILLDLSRVGEGRGTGTEAICREIASRYPGLEVICGGGVRDVNDLHRLRDCGASAALVASALHDGRIRPEDWPPQA